MQEGISGTCECGSARGEAEAIGIVSGVVSDGRRFARRSAGSASAIARTAHGEVKNGNAKSGVAVTFAVTSGGGTATGLSATTDANGVATVGSWTLGSQAGVNTLTASSLSLSPSLVTFTATAVANAGTATIAVAPGSLASQVAFAATAVGNRPSVVVKDANNNLVVGQSVTFAVASGGGFVTGGATVTDASGIATVGSWILGATVGTNTLTATSAGVTGSPVIFTATAGGGCCFFINAGNAQTATVGTAVATAPSVVVRDAYGNRISGVSVTFAVASGGGNATGTSTTTNASGIATVGSWTLGPAAGANSLTATSGGLVVTFTATGQ